MFSPRITRLRTVVILAVALFVWSDAALASFVCPHMSGCQHGMPAKAHSHVAVKPAAVGAMPCCPLKPEVVIECGISAMACCTWQKGDSDASAVLFASDHPRPKQITAVLPAAIPVPPSLAKRQPVPGLNADLAYIKPVTQKKTDLRI